MIVIGDVHGCFDELMDLISNLQHTDDLCFVGDLIDGGPKSKDVVDFVINNNYKSVLGNHEEFLIHSLYVDSNNDYCINKDVFDLWSLNGAVETLKSFENNSILEYLDWFKNLPLYIQHKDYLISHSYAENGIETDRDTLLWTRDMSKPINSNIINVFGHSIHDEPTIYHNIHLCIDTGVFLTGKLTAVDLDTGIFYSNK